MTTLVTPHFSLEELASHDGTAYPPEWVGDRALPLCSMLEVIRAAWGYPLTVVSGYRSPKHNADVGGAQASQHMEGRAADIRPQMVYGEVMSVTCDRLWHVIKDLFNRGQLPTLGGLGIYPGWVHVDTRERPPSGHLAQWSGVRVGDELAG